MAREYDHLVSADAGGLAPWARARRQHAMSRRSRRGAVHRGRLCCCWSSRRGAPRRCSSPRNASAQPPMTRRARQGRAAARRRHDRERQRQSAGRDAVGGPGQAPRRQDLARRAAPRQREADDQVVVKRPGWISWLAGKTETLHLTMITPVGQPAIALPDASAHGQPCCGCKFADPVRPSPTAHPRAPQRQRARRRRKQSVVAPRSTAPAGSIVVSRRRRAPGRPSSAAAGQLVPRRAQRDRGREPGARAPRSRPTTPITLTFSKPVVQGARAPSPPVVAAHPGHLAHAQRPHDRVPARGLRLRPRRPRHGRAAQRRQLVGGQQSGRSREGSWTVPGGSTLRLQQLLAQLGYLPLQLQLRRHSGRGRRRRRTEAARQPAAGQLQLALPEHAGGAQELWSPGASATMTKGAMMAFEDDHGLTADGDRRARRVEGADQRGRRRAQVDVRLHVRDGQRGQPRDPEHSGTTARPSCHGLVNTGIPSAPTATGTYPVFEHLRRCTMSGTNPDGSTYNDPGVPWTSATSTAATRCTASSAASTASRRASAASRCRTPRPPTVYPYTPIGTMVNVA